jgi:peptidase M1-like protein
MHPHGQEAYNDSLPEQDPAGRSRRVRMRFLLAGIHASHGDGRRTSMRDSLRFLAASLTALGLGAAGLGAATPADLTQQIQNPTLDLAGAVELKDLSVELGGGTFQVDEGVLVPGTPLSGRVVEMVFVGKGLFQLTPPNDIEAGQLEVFTQQTTLETGIDEAVFVVGDASIARRLLDHPHATLDSAAQTRAKEVFAAWAQGAEPRALGVDAALWGILSGDPLYQGYFAGEFHSQDLGKFCLVLDPSDDQQLMVGRFVPREMDVREKRDWESALQTAKKEGWALQRRLQDLGVWDTWMKASSQNPPGGSTSGSDSFEPEHYDLEARVDPKALTIEGKARLHLKAVREGSRAVALDLFEDLSPASIRDGAGQELEWYRSGSVLLVRLAEPVHLDDLVTLEVAYKGVILNERGPGTYSLRSTGGWYPHAGTIDRATYKLTLRWPGKYQVLSSGKVVESRQEDKDQIEIRVLEFPATFVSFEVGKFDVVEQQAGHVRMTLAFNRGMHTATKEVEQEVTDTLKSSLGFFEEKFGPYPLDYLTVVTIPQDYSQGFLGFLVLADDLLQYRTPFDKTEGRENWVSRQRMETVAHELSHQWWGNLVGWKSDRDQWLSEALASYSAVLYLQGDSDRRNVYLAEHSMSWKDSLRQTTLDGRSLESLGPVVMGLRLNSSLSSRAYEAVVYDKGERVFSMLARALGQDKLSQMLKVLVKAVSNRPIDTETFLAAMEKIGSVKLASFSKQFVYGTGIPEIYYSFQFRKSAEQWEVQGEVRQNLLTHYDYRVARKPNGWEIMSTRKKESQPPDWTLLVPLQVILEEEGEAGAAKPKKSDYTTGRGMGGTVKVSGQSTSFTFKIAKKPKDLWLDQNGEVLAYFFCSSREPKRALRYMAMEGPPEEGEATYKQALEAQLLSGEALKKSDLSSRELQAQSRLEDARIYFGLARWYLDRGRYDESRRALDSGEDLIRASEGQFWQMERAAIRSRLDLVQGEYKDVYSRLYHELRMIFPVKAGEGVSAVLRRGQWLKGRFGDAEDYAMLAVAALETDHADVARLAAKYAEDRGADMKELKQRLPTGKAE